uniref:Putative secreted protein n=1 Tax=Ixodes ricinus TaxID=34613 RepID=A0A6B0U988_IXORI
MCYNCSFFVFLLMLLLFLGSFIGFVIPDLDTLCVPQTSAEHLQQAHTQIGIIQTSIQQHTNPITTSELCLFRLLYSSFSRYSFFL